MSLGSRIQERLDAIGLSQAELARRVSMTQSSVNDLVNGKSRSSRKIVGIARELGTTPAYLMGQTDDPSAQFSGEELNSTERELVDSFRALTPKDQAFLLSMASRLAHENVGASIDAA